MKILKVTKNKRSIDTHNEHGHARGAALRLPPAPPTITKGSTLKTLLDHDAVECLIHNITLVEPSFNGDSFRRAALKGLGPLAILDRGQHLARALRVHLPQRYAEAIKILLKTLTPPLEKTDKIGLSVFFYLPHVSFVAQYGLDAQHNGGEDPFEISMKAQYELTRRFSAEYSIRPFLIHQQKRTLEKLYQWLTDKDPHVRRLCCEGTRSRLPWAIRIPAFVKDPKPVLPILEALKDDPVLYVRCSVANHVGDIAKDHPDVAFDICARWLKGASSERKWIIRHALRHPAKKNVREALRLRRLAGE